MGLSEENFSVAFTLPRLGDLLLRELERAGSGINLDQCVPSEMSVRDLESFAILVAGSYGGEVNKPADPPKRKRTKARRKRTRARRSRPNPSPAARCFFLAKAVMKACAFERERAANEIADEAAALPTEYNEHHHRRLMRLKELRDKLHDFESTLSPDDKISTQDTGRLKERLDRDIQSSPRPLVVIPADDLKTHEEHFDECRDTIAYLLSETGLRNNVLANVFYADFKSNPKDATHRFSERVLLAREWIGKRNAT
ncbi:MAG: hypothetical protein WBP56_10075 [Polyangia bacterium]